MLALLLDFEQNLKKIISQGNNLVQGFNIRIFEFQLSSLSNYLENIKSYFKFYKCSNFIDSGRYGINNILCNNRIYLCNSYEKNVLNNAYRSASQTLPCH